MVTLECLIRIPVDINRLHIERSTRNDKHENLLPIELSLNHVLIHQKTMTHLALVIGTIPERLLILVHLLIREPIGRESMILLFHAKHNHATLRIRKSRISFPETPRKTAECRLEFNLGSFLLLAQPQNIWHESFHTNTKLTKTLRIRK